MEIALTEEDIERGRRICMLRQQLGMTQKDLARRLNVSLNTACGWEKGKGISVKHKYRLCRELGVSVEILDGNPSDLINAKAFQMTYLRRLNLCEDCQRKIEEAVRLYYEENGLLHK